MVFEIRRACAVQTFLGDEALPVVDHQLNAVLLDAAEVIHQRQSAPVGGGGCLAVGQHLIHRLTETFVPRGGGKALHKGSVDAIVAHPLEVKLHHGGVDGAEDFSRAAIGMLERRRHAGRLRQFAHIRPQLDVRVPRLKGFPCGVMVPAIVAAISLAAEPPLVAADDFACERAGIYGLGMGAEGKKGSQNEKPEHRGCFH